MSIFSGFATRKQQEKYNNCIVNTINLLQDAILQLTHYCRIPSSESQIFQTFLLDFREAVIKFASHMREMETHKHLPPKISPIVLDFVQKLSDKSEVERTPTVSRQSSAKTSQSRIKPSNVRITTKSMVNGISGAPEHREKAFSKEYGRRRRLYEQIKQCQLHQTIEQPQQNSDFDKMDMEDLLKTRPPLPSRLNIFGVNRKLFKNSNLYEITQFQQEQGNADALIPQRQSRSSPKTLDLPYSQYRGSTRHSNKPPFRTRQLGQGRYY